MLLPQLSHAVLQANTHKIVQTELVLVDGYQSPPTQALDWQSQILPDAWAKNHPGEHRDGWYRTTIHLEQAPDSLWAIYLPRIRMNLAVFVNGTLVGSGGSFTEPMARNWNRPLYYNIPASLLQAGDNTIHLRLGSYPANRSAMHPFYLGSDAELRPTYEMRFFWQIDLLKILCVAAAILGLFTLFIWYRDRRSGMYGWYAIGSLAWSAYIPYFFVADIPIASHYWIWLCFCSCFWMITGMMLFICYFIKQQKPQFFRAVLVYSVMATFATLISEPAAIVDVIAKFFIGYVVIVLTVSYWLLRFTWASRSLESWFILFSVLINVVFGINDLLILTYGFSPPDYLLHYGAPVMILAMGIILVERFVRTMKLSRNLNQRLDHRLREQKQELIVSHERIANMQKSYAVQQERERITRDIHDGLGGHLVSALAMTETGNIKGPLRDVIRESLDELRSIIDTASSDDDDFDALLSVLRHRYKVRCADHGIDLEWHVDDGIAYIDIDNMTAIQLTRILQEAMTNVFKHADATKVSVKIKAQIMDSSHMLRMHICDNGSGIHDQAIDGHGLPSMRKRAEEIGASIEMMNHQMGGLCIHLGLKIFGGDIFRQEAV